LSSRTSRLEAKDPFLIEYKESLREVLEGLNGVGGSGLRLLMVEMIRSRWIRDRRATYPYEVAWVFDKKDEAVSKMLTGLEESGDIEQVGLGRAKKGPMKPYKPRTLRKPSSPSHLGAVKKRVPGAKRT
jgi:hypothetical protein